MQYSSLNYSLKLLEKRDYSIGRLRQKLSEKKFAQDEIDKTISDLIDRKFLDDEKFARNFIRYQTSLKPIGKYLLEQKLKQKFIDYDIIQEVLAEIDDKKEIDVAREATEKWLEKQNYELSVSAGTSPDGRIMSYGERQKHRNKLARHLIGRGFNWEIVKEILDNF